MSKQKYFVVNKATGKERPVAAERVLNPLGEMRMDGWSNLVTGLGTSADKRMAGNVTWNPRDMEFYEQLYSGDELASRIVDIIPNDSLREWLEPQGYAPNVLKEVDKRMAALDVRGSCERTWKWGRAFGGALQYVVTDCIDPAQPMVPEREKVLALRELSRYDLRILTTDIESDFGHPNFGRPNIYYLNVQVGSNVKLYPIHWTRVIRYDGKMVPRRTYIRNNYWHDSELQRLFNVIRNYQTSNDAAAGILQDFNTGVYKMKDLENLMSAGKEAVVKKRIEMINYCKSTIRAVLLDADSEEFIDLSRNVTGLPEMLDHMARRFVAATDIPHTKMLGESPDGSNATGNSTMQLWHQYIRSEQNNYLRPKLNELFGKLFYDMPELTYKFKKLQHLTEMEDAELRNKNAQTDSLYISDTVLDPTEVAKSRFGGSEYGTEIKLDMEAREEGVIGSIKEEPDFTPGGGDEEQPFGGSPAAQMPGVKAKKDGEEGDFPEEDQPEEAPPTDEEEADYNPWQEEEEEEALPLSLQDKPTNPLGVETPKEGGQWNPRNNTVPSKTKKQTSFISQTESLPMRDPKTDPRLPPPGRKPTRVPDYAGEYSAAGGSQKIKGAEKKDGFKESDHPRKGNGEFGSGGGSSGGASLQAQFKEKHPEVSGDKVHSAGHTREEAMAKARAMRAKGTFASIFHQAGPRTGSKSQYFVTVGSSKEDTDPSMDPHQDAGESSLMPRQLDHTKKASGPLAEIGEIFGQRLNEALGKTRQRVHGTSVVVRFADQILMGKRRDSGKWALPGGKCEPGENSKLTARRELWEETGLRTTKLLPMKQFETENATVSTFQCILASQPQVTHTGDPDNEFSELRWVDVKDGLPAEIAGNLHHNPNVALLAVGLGESDT